MLLEAMHELRKAIPDADTLLALEPEELGAKILFLLRKRMARERGDQFHPANLISELIARSHPDSTIVEYPSEKVREIGIAGSEAFAWLEAQGLIVPSPVSASGYKVLSRRARKFEDKTQLLQFATAPQLPKEILHPSLPESVWNSLTRGEFADAVFDAMREVEIAVREAAGFGPGHHGVPMIRKAFHEETGPLRDSSPEKAERENLAHLFTGAIGFYKNRYSHRRVPMDDPTEAIEIIMLASHLLRIVDARRQTKIEEE